MEALQGQGAYGAVYRAVRVGQEQLGPVALKVSLSPWDMRFAREAQLLSRLSLPGVPRLLDQGVVRHSSGGEYAFVVMEWVEGTPLYAWAGQHAPSGQELCRVLARLARTLEALHGAGVVHRDVKGDNVLVRVSDRFPVLIDFGSGHFQGASRLTWQSLPPSTPEYLSRQACRFEIGLARHRDSYYPPSPADDLYALGVTAYRLVMGQYPPPVETQEDEEGNWRLITVDPRPLLERNPRVAPGLRAVILRLLSEAPEARGTAAQAAEALEAAAIEPVPRLPERVRPPARAWTLKPWLGLAAVGAGAVLLWNTPPVPVSPHHVTASPPRASAFQPPDAGTSAVGDSSPTEAQAATPPPTEKKPVAQEPLPEPRPGQIRPNKRGKCPGRKQVAINGGCWMEVRSMTAEECVENGSVRFEGRCYTPIAAPKQPPPTSSPADAR